MIKIFFGILNPFDLCQLAPSHTKRIMSFLYSSDSLSKNRFIISVLQSGITKKTLSPVFGSIAPNTYLYSLIWWQGISGLFHFLQQQYFGLFILPNLALSSNISLIFLFSKNVFSSSTLYLIFSRILSPHYLLSVDVYFFALFFFIHAFLTLYIFGFHLYCVRLILYILFLFI